MRILYNENKVFKNYRKKKQIENKIFVNCYQKIKSTEMFVINLIFFDFINFSQPFLKKI